MTLIRIYVSTDSAYEGNLRSLLKYIEFESPKELSYSASSTGSYTEDIEITKSDEWNKEFLQHRSSLKDALFIYVGDDMEGFYLGDRVQSLVVEIYNKLREK